MKILDIIQRGPSPQPWQEGQKIPWDDPQFSQRMLKEHLSQQHDAASRRFATIDQHVAWIHQHVLKGTQARILDLGCGPGLYTSRLARLGHDCVGVDFSPASIAYARQQASSEGQTCRYIQQDMRKFEAGSGFNLVMSIFGEFNVFKREDAKKILRSAWHALLPGGSLLVEPHTFEKIKEIGNSPASWYSSRQGLFSDQSHLVLQENFWIEPANVAIERYFVIDAISGEATIISSSMQAYSNDDYRTLFEECGFGEIVFYSALGDVAGDRKYGLFAILAKKSAGQ